MRRAQLFAMAALFLALQPGLIFAPAYANDLTNLIGGLTGFADIDSRQVQVERRIRDAISSGRLTWAEGDVYLKQLAQIEKAEADYRVSENKLTTWESMRLSLDLDKLSRELETHMRDRKSGSVDIDAMQADVLKRITDGLSSRRLTQQEYDDLKYDFDRAAALEAHYRQSDNRLDYEETLKVALDLDRLSSKLERNLHDRDVSIGDADTRQAELDKKISEGLGSGRLTGDEAQQLRSQFNRINEREAALKASGHPVSADDRLSLLIDLERLNTQIEMKLNNTETASAPGSTQINLKQSQIETLVSESLVQGRLTPLEAQQFKTQLDRVQTLIRDLSQSDGRLTSDEQQTISIEYSMLGQRINRMLYARTTAWQGITGRLAEIEQRINDSASSRRLTDAEASALRADLQRIKELSASTRKTDGSFALDSSLTIAGDLERLSNRVNQRMHDRTEISVDLDQKQMALDKQIADGVFEGTLTLAEARELDSEGDRIARKEAELRASQGLNYREKLALAYDLEQLTTRVDEKVRDSEKQPINLANQKSIIDKQVVAASISGRITNDEARAIKAEKDRLNALEFQCRSSDGRLTAGESILIVSEWDKLRRDVKRQTQDKERDLSDIDVRQAKVSRRIAEGAGSGRLTPREAERLTKEFDEITAQEAQFRADGGLSYGESLNLGISLEQLTRRVENAIANGRVNLPDVDTKQREIDIELASAVASGRLALKDAQDFRAEIDRLAALEVSYRQSGGGISPSETQMLLTDLDKLQATVDARLQDRKPVWTGIDGRRNEVSKQIASLEQSKKLKPEELFKFKSELNRITQAHSAFMASGGAIDLAETVSLVNDLDLLKRRIDNRTGTISVNLAWDDIDGRQADLDRRINKALMRRMISPVEAQKLKTEFAKIHQAESIFKANDGSLSYFEKMALAGQLDKLNRQLPQRIED